jgi:hypothetical protein
MRSLKLTAACVVLQLWQAGSAFPLTLKLDGSCSYFGERLPVSTEIARATNNVATLIQRIVDVSGLARNFEIGAAHVPNAAAVTLGSTRYILYNPSFIDSITAKTRNRWAAAGILAHEVGHHLNGHTLQAGGSRPEIEREADYFSGFVLQKLGARLRDATAVMEILAPEVGSPTHPAKKERLASITAGWSKACERDPDCPTYSIPDDNEPNLDASDTDTPANGMQKLTSPGRVLQHVQ